MRFILGVDEAGRGPLAGPVAVGLIAAPTGFDFLSAFPGLNDSKQLSEKTREHLYRLLTEHEEVRFRAVFGSNTHIDAFGITKTVTLAIRRGIKALDVLPDEGHVLLDGLLHAPDAYSQETIVRGDQTVPAIMLASVVAKVSRDRLMRRLAKKYPLYGFERHKGYPTKSHYQAIKRHGLCDLHRRSYCRSSAER